MAQTAKHARNVPAARSIYETAPKALLIMLFSGLFILLLLTALIANSQSPAEFTVILAPLALTVGVMSGGLFCGKRLQGSDGCVCAAMSAVILTVLLLAVRMFIPAPDERLGIAVSVIIHILTVTTAVLSALAANRLSQKRRRKKLKHRS